MRSVWPPTSSEDHHKTLATDFGIWDRRKKKEKIMKHRILITSLNSRDVKEGLQYFYFNDGEKNVYCDAMTSAEAGSKYILANYEIDTILTFGSDSSYDEGDDLKTMMLADGKSLYTADMNNMSSYSLYRYRLAEFLDEVNAENQDVSELLDGDQQLAATNFIRRYFNERVHTAGPHKFNRLFDRLVRDDDLRADMESRLLEAAEAAGADPGSFLAWTRNYVFREFRETSKMQLLDDNDNVRIKFVSSGDYTDYENSFTDLLIRNIDEISSISEAGDGEIDIFMCLQNDNARDAFVLTSLMMTIKTLPGLRVNIVKILMTDSPSSRMAAAITDDTGKIMVYDLMSANKAFLRYGQADMFIDFRYNSGLRNPDIDRILYAMRNIDTGISLCDITDIERGIGRLREFFAEDRRISGDTFAEKYFNVIAYGIKEDYAPLLKGSSIEFIELVKWAYRKGFWQQTLTLIESRAPRDMVEKGIYFYCDSEEDRDKVTEQFGRIYNDLKSFEKYKLDDVEHYYVKFYSRWRAPHPRDNREYMLGYAGVRVSELDTDDKELIRAHTLCTDRDALKDLLFAYYNVGDVRNATNHAEADFSGFDSIRKDSDISDRMNMISQAVEYFVHCYDKVLKMLEGSGDGREVIWITNAEIAACARSMGRPPRDDFRSRDKDKDKDKDKDIDTDSGKDKDTDKEKDKDTDKDKDKEKEK